VLVIWNSKRSFKLLQLLQELFFIMMMCVMTEFLSYIHSVNYVIKSFYSEIG